MTKGVTAVDGAFCFFAFWSTVKADAVKGVDVCTVFGFDSNKLLRIHQGIL